MTKFKLTSNVLNIINALLQAGISGCSIHEARGYLDELFDDFEEHEGVTTNETNNRSDLEHFFYTVNSLYEEGYQLYLDGLQRDKDVPTLEAILNDIATKEEKFSKALKHYLHTIDQLHEDSYIIFLDESEGDFLDDVAYLESEGICHEAV
jgi:hypothetical protein